MLSFFTLVFAAMSSPGNEPDTTRTISLPPPNVSSDYSVEEALAYRRSIRRFTARPLTLEDIGQLLWAAQGLRSTATGRTAPSAGALYPLEVYLIAGDVDGLDSGVYKYQPLGHKMRLQQAGDHRDIVARAAWGQDWMADGAAIVVITAVYARTARKYGRRAERYVHIEVGHAAQNIYLQAQTMGLGTTIVGAFRDSKVRDVLELPADEAPLALLPVGHRE